MVELARMSTCFSDVIRGIVVISFAVLTNVVYLCACHTGKCFGVATAGEGGQPRLAAFCLWRCSPLAVGCSFERCVHVCIAGSGLNCGCCCPKVRHLT